MKLPIPAATLDQHIIALGKTGSGKSSKMRVLIEHLLRKRERVTIIDIKGDWWGLKSSADGKHDGFHIVILGGKHADVPLLPGSGRAVAELLNTASFPCLIDLRGWRPSDRAKFYIDFMDTTVEKSEGKRYIMIAEVHNFAPKGKVLSPQAGEMLHWSNRLASEGRGVGITLMADSQRPQKVHNDLLTSCETLIACKVIHKSDRGAVEDWIDGCADPDKGKEVLRELASMKKPDSWVWSPEIDFGPQRVEWPLFETFDSFKPQEARAGKLKGWADVDLEAVKSKLATVVQEAQANDPATLRREIERLKKVAATAQPDMVPESRLLEVREYSAAFTAACAEQADGVKQAADELAQIRDELNKATTRLKGLAEMTRRAKLPPKITMPATMTKEQVDRTVRALTDSRPAAVIVDDPARESGNGKESPSVRKILDVIHRSYPVSMSFDAAARRAGISKASSAYRRYRKAIQASAELEHDDGRFRSVARFANAMPFSTRTSVAEWAQKLPPAYGKMLMVIFENGPLDKPSVAEKSGVSPTSSGLGAGLKELRRLALVVDKGGLYEIAEGLT